MAFCSQAWDQSFGQYPSPRACGTLAKEYKARHRVTCRSMQQRKPSRFDLAHRTNNADAVLVIARRKLRRLKRSPVKALSSSVNKALNRPHWPNEMSQCEDGFCIVLTSVFCVGLRESLHCWFLALNRLREGQRIARHLFLWQ